MATKAITLPAPGSTGWGTALNANFTSILSAFGASTAAIALTGLTSRDITSDESQNMSLYFTGTPSSNVAINLPSGVAGQWVIRNTTAKVLTVASLTGGGSTIDVTATSIRSVYCDGTNVYFADNQSGGATTQVAYNLNGELVGSPDMTFDGATFTLGGSASITGWTTVSGGFKATFNADKLVPVGSYVFLTGVTTTPASPNLFNAAFLVTASTQAVGASTVTITATGIGSAPSGGTLGYGNLTVAGTAVAVSGSSLNLLSGRTSISSPNVDENRTAGVSTTAVDDGTKSSGTYTPTIVGGNMRYLNNAGAFTFAIPADANDYTMVVKITNVTGAGTITVSGSYTKVTGSALTTTVGSKFLVYITKINGSYVANIVALQ